MKKKVLLISVLLILLTLVPFIIGNPLLPDYKLSDPKFELPTLSLWEWVKGPFGG